MRSRTPTWPAFFLILWLPLQGFAMPLMPFCRHGHPQEATMSAGHCQHEPSAQASADSGNHAQDCDGCSLCHLAGASAPISDSPRLVGVAPVADLPPYCVFYRSHIPERVQRPPLGQIACPS